MAKTKIKTFTVTKISYEGYDPELDQRFYKAVGINTYKKWLGSGFGTISKVRDISFTDLTTKERRRLCSIAQDIYPGYIGSTTQTIPTKK